MSTSPSVLDKTTRVSTTTVLKDTFLTSLLAGFLGLALIYGAGFAETAVVHNAAHDGRHAAGFPCH